MSLRALRQLEVKCGKFSHRYRAARRAESMTDDINTPLVKDIWLRALPASRGAKNDDF